MLEVQPSFPTQTLSQHPPGAERINLVCGVSETYRCVDHMVEPRSLILKMSTRGSEGHLELRITGLSKREGQRGKKNK